MALVLFSCSVQAQEQEKSYDDIIYLGLPSYMNKPNNSELTDFINKRKNLFITLPTSNTIFYTFGNIIVDLSAFNSVRKNNFLESQKEFFDYMEAQGTGTTSYSSEIKIINNANVLIVHGIRPTNYCTYDIYATNLKYNKWASISINYKLSDKAAAEKIAETILANLRFVEKPIIRQR
jgi:hypothetical protein